MNNYSSPSPLNTKHCLIVEGGAMRGIFAAGVFDAWLENPAQVPQFDWCMGVSAGSTALASWLSKQHGRTYKVITDYSCRPEFINLLRFIRGGHGLDLDWLWEICLKEYPIDLDILFSSQIPLYAVTTQVSTGHAHYIQATPNNAETLLKASCSVPLAYRDYPKVFEQAMTDGGVADSIPVQRAYEMGAREITVVLSNPDGYCKSAPKSPWFTQRLFKTSPALGQAMLKRADVYNQSMGFIKSPPKDCKIKVIAPPAQFPVKRLTKQKEKLDIGYQMGKDAGVDFLKQHASALKSDR